MSVSRLARSQATRRKTCFDRVRARKDYFAMFGINLGVTKTF